MLIRTSALNEAILRQIFTCDGRLPSSHFEEWSNLNSFGLCYKRNPKIDDGVLIFGATFIAKLKRRNHRVHSLLDSSNIVNR